MISLAVSESSAAAICNLPLMQTTVRMAPNPRMIHRGRTRSIFSLREPSSAWPTGLFVMTSLGYRDGRYALITKGDSTEACAIPKHDRGAITLPCAAASRGPDVEVELALAQPLKEELVQPVGRVQWNPMAGVVDLLVAPGSFHEAS